MTDAITIGVASDTKAFEAGIASGVVKPLETVEETAEKAGKAGDKAGDQITDGMKDAQKATESLSKDYKKLADNIVDQSRTASRKASDSFDDIERKGSESFRELGSEAKQNASETFSSFDGSAQSFVDGIQGTLGGIVSSLGPIGAAAGAAGALGIGLITSAFQTAADKADELKQRTADAFDDMIKSGDKFVSQQFTSDALKDIVQDANKVKDAKAQAKTLDLDTETILLAQVGDANALATVHAQIASKTAEIKSDKDTIANQDGSATLAMSDQLDKLARIDDTYEAIAKSNDSAANAADLYLKTTNQLVDGTQRVADNVNKIPDLKTIKLTIDDSAYRDFATRVAKGIDVPLNLRGRNGVGVQ